MVFIVKLPARSASQRPLRTEDGGQVPFGTGDAQESVGDMPRAAPPVSVATWAPSPAAAPVAQTGAVPRADDAPSTPPTAQSAVPKREDAPETRAAPVQRTLDILLAPSVLRHRYVRGVDKSSIVERPERIRAVLLGIAGAYGLYDTLPKSAKAETPDDLAAMLSGMDMNKERPAEPPAMRVFVSGRSVALDDTEPALAFVHAHEPAAYDTATQYTPDSVAHGTTHLARLVQLGAQAPNAAPDRVQHRAAAGSDDSSSDGEGDARMHPSEVPEQLPQGDLYLCGPHAAGTQDTHDGGSREAISHALGAAIDAVDRVVAGAQAAPPVRTDPELRPLAAAAALAADSAAAAAHASEHIPARRAFVLSRPPGHHCSGAEPQGFCWVNNAVVAAAHAHAVHGIDRVVVLDIDLHHGNGTQSLAWRINAEAVKADADRAARLAAHRRATRGRKQERRETYEQLCEDEAVVGRRALQICYTSLHDIDSFPCEDGDAEYVRNASVCLGGAHGQWIWNVHLATHRDDAEFDRLYTEKYAAILAQAREFARATHAHAPRTLVLISCGFDACTYEYPGMQRHGKHVPPAFYARFARDAAQLADEIADGKLVSLLEGGYSDRALTSGALAHVGALAGLDGTQHEPRPWSLDHLAQLERMAKRVGAAGTTAPGGVPASVGRRRTTQHAPWLVRASEYFAAFQHACGHAARPLDLAPSVPSTPRGGARGVLRGLDDTATPTRTHAGGHALRDRSVLRSRSQANLYADATPARTRARPPVPVRDEVPHTPTPAAPAAPHDAATPTPGAAAAAPTPTPKRQPDPANWVPGALPVESVPSTPVKPGGM